MLRATLALVLSLLCLVSFAQAPRHPEVAARSWLLIDMSANQVLGAHDPDRPVEPASLTKLMTAYIVFDALRARKISLQQRLPVSDRAGKMPGSRMFIDPGMQVPVEDLIKGMVVQSGNDATIVLAEGVGGSVEHFVELMNQQARAMGLRSTAYKNPEGLATRGHTTTARDLATLAARLIQEFPDHIGYYSIKEYRYEGTRTANDTNRNLLLFRDPTVDGLKTGHTEAAGYCIIATARRDFPNFQGRRLIAIVLGAASETGRANEAQKLLNWGYTAWEGIKLFDANQTVVEPAIWKGSDKTVRLGQFKPIVVATPAGTAGKLRTQVARPEPMVAPIRKGQAVGVLKVLNGEQVVAEVPLMALTAVDEAGLLSRAWDALRLWIK